MTESAAFRRGADRHRTGSNPPSRQATVLVLGRSEPAWRLVAATVHEAGYDLVETASLPETLDHVRGLPPDLVLLPGDLEGLELLERIRDEERWDSLPAIVLTPADNPAAMFEAFERGADDVVPYAAQPGELAARMRARLDRRAVSRADLLRDPATGALTEEKLLAIS